MDHLQQLISQVKRHLFVVVLIENGLLLGGGWLLYVDTSWQMHQIFGVLTLLAVVGALAIMLISSRYVLQPTKALWQAILHISPGNHAVQAPKVESIHAGRALVASLTAQIYQLTAQSEHTGEASGKETSAGAAEDMLRSLPLPFFALDKAQNIVFASGPALEYLGVEHGDTIIGKNFYSVCNLAFSGDGTFDSWLAEVSGKKALAFGSWDHVRLKVGDVDKQFDLAAHYSKDNPQGAETTLLLFDHSDVYGKEDQAVDFVAMSVHELRTPLTLLRGYIEVFEDELGESLSPEMKDFMHKMNASAQQLTAFVSNILNVARVDNDQLVLALQSEDWATLLRGAIDTLQLRAKVRGITLDCTIADNLPPVGVDSVSIYEVINNLVDNAIKYSGDSQKILISSQLTKDGFVETTVQDWGVGIPAGTVPNLFTKFYRNFRNRDQIGGTGLGLYLCKAIVAAHGGNIWVRSHDGQGSTFGFTLVPYTKLADDQKNGDNNEIVRGAHGWIKNHSLYRR